MASYQGYIGNERKFVGLLARDNTFECLRLPQATWLMCDQERFCLIRCTVPTCSKLNRSGEQPKCH